MSVPEQLPPDEVSIRPVAPTDLDTFFRLFRDPTSVTMAGFTAEDPDDRVAFEAHWRDVLASEAVTARTVLVDDAVVGHVASFEVDGVTEVTYWVDRAVWGRGIATRALELLLRTVPARPVYARAAADNQASLRVLAKSGFLPIRTELAYANARGEQITETVLRLD